MCSVYPLCIDFVPDWYYFVFYYYPDSANAFDIYGGGSNSYSYITTAKVVQYQFRIKAKKND